MAELKDALVHREDGDGWTGFGYPCSGCGVIFLEEYLLDKHQCPVEFHAACGMATQRLTLFSKSWCGRCNQEWPA